MSSGREGAQAKRASGPLADAAAGAGTARPAVLRSTAWPEEGIRLPETAWAFSMLAH